MPKTLLAIVDAPALREAIAVAAAELGYLAHSVTFATLPDDVVAFLVAHQPSLIILEIGPASSGHFRGERFVIDVKTSPATRRLPILAVIDNVDNADNATPEAMLHAKKAGCDAIMDRQSFLSGPTGAIARHARPDDSAELLRQAQLPLPALAHTAIEQFNQHEFWEQHETFETVWRAEPGPVRQMYQGILQIGVAYLQIQRKNYAGARKLFQRAWQYLNALPDVCQGIDIAQFKRDAQAAQDELERLGPERIAEFDAVLFQPIKQVTE
jgi:predicted metal-dependent hydrolase